jgi:hypothetical protein
MRLLIIILTGVIFTASSALGADYDRTEKSPLYELRLRVPAAVMAIPPLRDKVMAMYKADATQAKTDAKDDKDGNSNFTPYSIDTNWRVTFENDAVLSLSEEIYADTGGAHPNGGFQAIVWDKKENRAVPIEALFTPDQIKPPRGHGRKPTPNAAARSRGRMRTRPGKASARIRKNSRPMP